MLASAGAAGAAAAVVVFHVPNAPTKCPGHFKVEGKKNLLFIYLFILFFLY